MPCGGPKSLHVHPFNVISFPTLRDCKQPVCIFHLLTIIPFRFSFSHLGFWGGNFFLIAPFSEHCLLVPFHILQYAYYFIG